MCLLMLTIWLVQRGLPASSGATLALGTLDKICRIFIAMVNPKRKLEDDCRRFADNDRSSFQSYAPDQRMVSGCLLFVTNGWAEGEGRSVADKTRTSDRHPAFDLVLYPDGDRRRRSGAISQRIYRRRIASEILLVDDRICTHRSLQGVDERFRRSEDVMQRSELTKIGGLDQVKSEKVILQSGGRQHQALIDR